MRERPFDKRRGPLAVDPDPQLVELAMNLLKLGVSGPMVSELLGYDRAIIERQLAYLPYRKAKRPEAFIIEAIRNDYSPPKEFYASHTSQPPREGDSVDQDAE